MLRGVGGLPEGVVQVERRLLPGHVHHDDVVVGQLVADRGDISREEILRARRWLLTWLGPRVRVEVCVRVRIRVRVRVCVKVRVRVRGRGRGRGRVRVRAGLLTGLERAVVNELSYNGLAGAREGGERGRLDIRRCGVLRVEQRQAEEQVALSPRLFGGQWYVVRSEVHASG